MCAAMEKRWEMQFHENVETKEIGDVLCETKCVRQDEDGE